MLALKAAGFVAGYATSNRVIKRTMSRFTNQDELVEAMLRWSVPTIRSVLDDIDPPPSPPENFIISLN